MVVGVLHERRLGQLEAQPPRLQPALEQRRHQGRDEVGLAELAGRQVDVDRERPAPGLVAPAGQLGRRLPQDPGADRHDQPGLLGQRDERRRRHEPELGMVPPHEGLDAGHGPGRELDDRLVEHPQLVTLDGPVQGTLGLEVFDRLGPHGGVEELAPGPALLLGPVHRRVGVPQQGLGGAGAL